MLKLKINHTLPSFSIFTIIGFFFFLACSLDAIISPLYLKEFLQDDKIIGMYVSIKYSIMLLTCIYCINLYKEYSKVKVLLLALLIRVISMTGMGLSNGLATYIPFDILDIITYAVSMIGLGLFIADISTEENLSRHEGTYYSISNIGFLLGPILGGLIASKIGKEHGFFTAAFANFIILAYLFIKCYFMESGKIHHKHKNKHQLHDIWENTKDYFKSIDRIKAFLMCLGLHIWWGITIYKSLTILNKGFSAATLGMITGISCIPLILNEIRVGKLVEHRGLNLLFSKGFLFCALSAISFTLFDAYPMIILLMIVFSTIGGSYIEPIQEVYLLKSCKVNEREKFLSIFNTAKSIGIMITPAIASVFLIIGGYSTMWLSIAFIMLIFALIATTIEE